MLLNCDNKGCLQTSEAKLDERTGEVICNECGQPITNITETTKRVLKSFGQIIRHESKKPFMVECKHCMAQRQLVIDESDDTVCNVCLKHIGVHPSVKQAVKLAGMSTNATTRPKIKTGNKSKSTKSKKEDTK